LPASEGTADIANHTSPLLTLSDEARSIRLGIVI
jgi:hypothetical protein